MICEEGEKLALESSFNANFSDHEAQLMQVNDIHQQIIAVIGGLTNMELLLLMWLHWLIWEA